MSGRGLSVVHSVLHSSLMPLPLGGRHRERRVRLWLATATRRESSPELQGFHEASSPAGTFTFPDRRAVVDDCQFAVLIGIGFHFIIFQGMCV